MIDELAINYRNEIDKLRNENKKLQAENEKLKDVVDAFIAGKGKGCICHVKSCDGYQGTSHADWCIHYMDTIKKLEEIK